MIDKDKLIFYLYTLVFITLPFGLLVTLGKDSGTRVTLLDVSVIVFIIASSFVKRKTKNIPFTKEMKLFLFISLLTLTLQAVFTPTHSLYISLLYFIRLSLYFLFYIKSFSLVTSKNALFINRMLFISGYTLSLIGLIQYQVYPDLRNLLYLGWDPHYYRLFSTLFDPNFAGIIIVLTFFQYVFLLKYRKNTRSKLLDAVVLSVLLFSIYLTRSRSAYISLISGLVLYTFLIKNISMKVIGIAAGILLFANLLPKPPLDVFDLLRITSSVSRLNNWKEAILLGLKNPLLGIGFSNARFSDSSLLYVFAATGVFGLFAYLKLLIRIITFGLTKDKELVTLTGVLVISSLFNNTLFYPFSAVWFFAFLVSSVSRASRR